MPEMVELAGGLDVAGPSGAKSPEVAWERLAALAPEVVIVMPCGMDAEGSRAEAEEHRERIATLGATRIFAVDAASTYSRPGPRLVDGVELLAHLLHPDLVEAPGGIDHVDLSAAIVGA
jgi:iron complex transport system substrate-binding protein